MAIQKKPWRLAALSAAGFIASLAGPSAAIGQTESLQDAPTVVGSFVQDSVPFAKPYAPDRQAKNTFEAPTIHSPLTIPSKSSPSKLSTRPLPSTDSFGTAFEPLENSEVTIEHLAVPMPAVPFTDGHQTATSKLKSQVSMPTVIVRPPINPTQSLDALTVDVEKIVTQTGDDYTLKLVIPKSVKVIELTPVAESDSPRNFKIRVVQTGVQVTDNDANESVNSRYSMPVHSNRDQPSRFLPSGFRQNINPIRPMIQNENGFKKNPFYQPLNIDQNTVEINEVYSDVVQATAESPSHELTVEQPADPVASDIASNIESEMYGPADIGLNATGDFVIYVANRTAESVKQVTVNLRVPTGLDVVVVDRAAEVDADAGSLTWTFEELAPGDEHFIRYRVKSLELGSQKQRVSISPENGPHLECEFDTNVLIECEESSAPFLPFESE